MNWKYVKNISNTKFRRLVGVKRSTFEIMVTELKPIWKLKQAVGGRPKKLSLENSLLLAMGYYREYSSMAKTGSYFKVSESTAFRTIIGIENELIKLKCFHLPGKKSLYKNTYEIIKIDVSECPIERPKRKSSGRRRNRQKHYYSGKKKKHSLKVQVVVENRKILSTSFSNGKRHDFRILKESKLPLQKSTIVEVDLGYQGIKKYHDNSSVPHKKTKKNPLTMEQKNQNKEQASSRVEVEHVFASIKRFKIISQKYRNRRRRFGLRFNLISAIHNLEWNAKL